MAADNWNYLYYLIAMIPIGGTVYIIYRNKRRADRSERFLASTSSLGRYPSWASSGVRSDESSSDGSEGHAGSIISVHRGPGRQRPARVYRYSPRQLMRYRSEYEEPAPPYSELPRVIPSPAVPAPDYEGPKEEENTAAPAAPALALAPRVTPPRATHVGQWHSARFNDHFFFGPQDTVHEGP